MFKTQDLAFPVIVEAARSPRFAHRVMFDDVESLHGWMDRIAAEYVRVSFPGSTPSTAPYNYRAPMRDAISLDEISFPARVSWRFGGSMQHWVVKDADGLHSAMAVLGVSRIRVSPRDEIPATDRPNYEVKE